MQYEYKLYITQPENFPISTLNKRKRKREKKPKSLLNHLDVKANSREKKNKKQKQIWVSYQLQPISFFPTGEKKNSANFTYPFPYLQESPIKKNKGYAQAVLS